MTELASWSLPAGQVGDAWAFFALGSVSVMLFSVAKAGFGGSIGLLSVPVMIYACGGNVRLATGIMLPLLIACDYFAMVCWWGKWDRRAVFLLLPGAVAGIAVGWATLWAIRQASAGDQTDLANAWLMLGIAAVAIGFVILRTVRALRSGSSAFTPAPWQGALAGAAAGFTSTLAHAAGPITTMYLLPQQMPKGRYVASTVLYYWIGNQLKLAPYFALGMIHADSLGSGVALVPAVVAGTLLGIFLHRRVGEKQFNGVVYVLLALTGLHLSVKAARTLWL